jgi:hypothetical protein
VAQIGLRFVQRDAHRGRSAGLAGRLVHQFVDILLGEAHAVVAQQVDGLAQPAIGTGHVKIGKSVV